MDDSEEPDMSEMDEIDENEDWQEIEEDYEDEQHIEEEILDDVDDIVEEDTEYEEKYIPPIIVQDVKPQKVIKIKTEKKTVPTATVTSAKGNASHEMLVSEFVDIHPKNPYDVEELEVECDVFGKKRWKRANPEQWERNITKKLRNSGQAYKGKNGVVPAKSPRPIDCSNCKFRCTYHFTEEDRAAICTSYWKLEDYCRKKDFILMNVKSVPPKRRKENVVSGKHRTNAKIFYFQKFDTSYRVCQSFFLKTLAISNGPLMKAFEKVNCYTNFFDGQDQRGRHPPANKMSEEDVRKIKEHIESFPYTEVTRKKSKKRMLDGSLTIQKMYNFYKDIATSRGDKIPSITTYKRIFGRFYNYSFTKKNKREVKEEKAPERIQLHTLDKIDLAQLKQEVVASGGAQYENFNIQVIEIPPESVYTYG